MLNVPPVIEQLPVILRVAEAWKSSKVKLNSAELMKLPVILRMPVPLVGEIKNRPPVEEKLPFTFIVLEYELVGPSPKVPPA